MKQVGIHYAKLEKSPRLQRMLDFLRERGHRGATTREIIECADICAVGTSADELRCNGFNVTCDFEGQTISKSKIFRYRLIEAND